MQGDRLARRLVRDGVPARTRWRTYVYHVTLSNNYLPSITGDHRAGMASLAPLRRLEPRHTLAKGKDRGLALDLRAPGLVGCEIFVAGPGFEPGTFGL